MTPEELIRRIGADLIELLNTVVSLENDRDEKLYRAAMMIQQLKEANASLMERINEMAEETAEIEAEGLPDDLAGLHGLEGLRALVERENPEPPEDVAGWVEP